MTEIGGIPLKQDIEVLQSAAEFILLVLYKHNFVNWDFRCHWILMKSSTVCAKKYLYLTIRTQIPCH